MGTITQEKGFPRAEMHIPVILCYTTDTHVQMHSWEGQWAQSNEISCLFDLSNPLPANLSPSSCISKSKSFEQFPADPFGDGRKGTNIKYYVSGKGTSTARTTLARGSHRQFLGQVFFHLNWAFAFHFGRFWVNALWIFFVFVYNYMLLE